MILGTFRPRFLPDLEYFWQIAQCDVMVFTDHLAFSKGSDSNRSAPFPDGQTILRIPILHNKNRNQISEAQIDFHNNWADKHLKTIHHFFHNLPYAYYYLPQLEALFQSKTQTLGDFLFELQSKFIHWLYLPVQILRSSQIENKDTAENLITDWCLHTHSNIFINQTETFDNHWINKEALQKNGIATQVFVPLPSSHLLKNYQSIVILQFLFQFGPEAGYILQQYLPPRK